ncbi:hypothetical protein B566_EDAN003600 [Ephemera danica]|nr:hypothetical protein B566_EDAN003600 [Ephemera danica]
MIVFNYYASAAFGNAGGGGGGGGHSRLVPPLKRPRLMVPPGGRPILKATPPQKVQMTPVSQLKTYSNPDILICGNCRDMFTDLQELLEHKKSYCKLRFTCKCHVHNGIKPTSECNGNGELAESEAALLCVQCKDSFSSAWDLMVHVQAAHMLNIYELGVPQRRARSSSSSQHEDVEGNQQLASPQPQPVLVKDSSPSPATPPVPAVVCPVPADKEELEGTSPRAVQDEAPTPGMPEGAVLLDVDDDDLDEMDEDDEEDDLLRELRGAASEAASRCRLVNNNVEPPVTKQRPPAPQNCIMRAVRLQNATGDLGALKADVTMLTVADGHQE